MADDDKTEEIKKEYDHYKEEVGKVSATLPDMASQIDNPHSVKINHTPNKKWVKGVEIQTTTDDKGVVTSVNRKYNFITNDDKKPALNPSYSEETVTTQSSKNSWQQKKVLVQEEPYSSDVMCHYETELNNTVTHRGNNVLHTSTHSSPGVGIRTDELTTSKGKISVQGTNMVDGGINAIVDVKADLGTHEFEAYNHYERTTTTNGDVTYQLKDETYLVRNKETQDNHIYVKDRDGNLKVTLYNTQSEQQTDLTLTDKMKKDAQKAFKKYHKLNDKYIKQVSKQKNSQAYMEATPQAIKTTMTEKTTGQQALEYAQKAKNDVQMLINRQANTGR